MYILALDSIDWVSISCEAWGLFNILSASVFSYNKSIKQHFIISDDTCSTKINYMYVLPMKTYIS